MDGSEAFVCNAINAAGGAGTSKTSSSEVGGDAWSSMEGDDVLGLSSAWNGLWYLSPYCLLSWGGFEPRDPVMPHFRGKLEAIL